MYKTIKLLAVALPFLLSNIAYGAGYALYEFSARGTAMGGATMANTAEAASLAVNPALITELEGNHAQAGLTVVTAKATTTFAGYTRSLKSDAWALPNIFVTHQVSDDVFVGLGGYSRYGLGGEYKNFRTWPGSAMAYKVKLETFSFTPTIAIKMNDELAVSMNLEAMVIGFSQSSLGSNPATGAFLPNMGYDISGSGVSWGGRFGILYRPLWAENWGFGATYQSKVKQTLNGRVQSNFPGINPGDARGSIALPDSINAGIAFKPTEKWTFEGGIVGTFWSSYDQIMIEYKDLSSSGATQNPVINKKNYKDTYRLNFGAEYLLNQAWALRAGYVYDKSPINHDYMDTLVPVDNRHIASIGCGYKTGDWTIDLAYARIFSEDLSGKTSPQYGNRPMKYTDGSSNMYALTVGYKF